MSLYTAVFIGPQGCGKGTQHALLQNELQARGENVVHFEAGLFLRKLADTKSYTGRVVEGFTENGMMVPDFCSSALLFCQLKETMTEDSHVLIDGFPRSVVQAHTAEDIFEFYNRKQVDIIFLTLPRELSIKRLLERGRTDDKVVEVIEKRLELYEIETRPVLDYFQDMPRYTIHEINGNQSVEDVYRDIKKAINF
jgi:adenylate kinase